MAVKDEFDMVPYSTTAGTRFLCRKKAQSDSTVVARLRSAGALLLGKTNMYAIGILPDGLNAHYGPVRNPYRLHTRLAAAPADLQPPSQPACARLQLELMAGARSEYPPRFAVSSD